MPRTPKSVASSNGRLDSKNWIEGALVQLADHGIDGVRIEVLARALGVTKGSFYWHFKDRDALLEAMLQTWRRKSTLQLMERLGQGSVSPIQRLDSLLKFPFASPNSRLGADVELAIRLWGRHDPRARSALAEIDELRMGFIKSIFVDLGMTQKSAEARAALVYGFMRVGASLPVEQPSVALCDEIGTALARTCTRTN